MNAKEIAIGFVNGVTIKVIENGQRLVPIKPICEALEINFSSQIQKLKEDPILNSTMVLSTTVAADGKEREMQCLPLKYVFGWLFKIDVRNVKEEAKGLLMNYQLACYDALYDYFTKHMDFVNERQAAIDVLLEKLEAAKLNFKTAKDVMQGVEQQLKTVRGVTFEVYLAREGQLSLFSEVFENA